MKVRLKQDVDPRSPAIAGWLKPGREYVVLAVEQHSTGVAGYRIASDDNGQPVVFETRLFDVTDAALPHSWIVLGVQCATVELGPQQFGARGFWERVFDRDPDALREYAEAKETVLAES